MKKIKYSCPDGHVLGDPSKDTEQSLGISDFEVVCDADRHWRPLLAFNQFPNPPVMPECLGKCYIYSDKFSES